MMDSRDLRAASAGALLAQQLRLCMRAEAQAKPYPPVENVGFDSPHEVADTFGVIAAVLGNQTPDEQAHARLVMLFQALAEVISEQGCDLEAKFYNLIHPGETKSVWRTYVSQEGVA
jgi:hypothetical protein